MTREDFISKFEEICELPSHSLKGNEQLTDSTLIDSLALLGIISVLDKDFGIHLTISEIMSAGTLDNLYSKVSNQYSIH